MFTQGEEDKAFLFNGNYSLQADVLFSVFSRSFLEKHVYFFSQGPSLLSYFGILHVTAPCALCHSVIVSPVIKDKLI